MLSTPILEGKFVATVLPTYVLKSEEAISEVAKQADYPEGTVQNILSAYMDVIARNFANGATVHIGEIGRIFPSLGGSYDSPNDSADKANLHINFVVSKAYTAQLFALASLEKVATAPKEPILLSFKDLTMDAEDVFTMGGIVSLLGDKLDFDVKNLEEGVFIEAVGYSGLVRVQSYGQCGTKHIDFSLPNTLFSSRNMSVVTEAGVTFTVKCNYGGQTLRTKEYTTTVYEGAFGGSTKLTGFVGVTGTGLLRAIRDDVGEGIKMAYQEHGAQAFGTAVAIAATTAETTYTLPGNDPAAYALSGNKSTTRALSGNSLTVRVKGKRFYDYIASTGIVNGESINPEIFVI
jgi:hypothetical protein